MELTTFANYLFVDYNGYVNDVTVETKLKYFSFVQSLYYFHKPLLSCFIASAPELNNVHLIDYIAKMNAIQQYKKIPKWVLSFINIINK